MRYYRITNTTCDELLAIVKGRVTLIKENTDFHDEAILDGIRKENTDFVKDFIKKKIGFDDWRWKDITQAEYETFQAFGIKEIDLNKELGNSEDT